MLQMVKNWTNRNRALGSELRKNWVALSPAVRWGGGGACVLLLLLTAIVTQMDMSRRLTSAELGRLTWFVEATGDTTVIAAYRNAVADAVVTVDEAQSVMETAKAHPPPYGLASPQ